MPLEDDRPHFNLDSWGGWIWPYRIHLSHPQTTRVRVTARNPLPREATLNLKLVGPQSWQGSWTSLIAPARAEVSCELTITPSGQCCRQPFALELEVEGHPFGQVAEALMTVGKDEAMDEFPPYMLKTRPSPPNERKKYAKWVVAILTGHEFLKPIVQRVYVGVLPNAIMAILIHSKVYK